MQIQEVQVQAIGEGKKGDKNLVRLLLALLVTLGVVKPLNELLGALANLAARGEVDVLLASLGTPSLEGLFRHEVVLVDLQQNAGDLGDELRVVVSDEALDATEESLLVTLRSDELLEHGSTRLNLLDNTGREDGLGENSGRAVLALDAQLLGLEVDLDVGDLVDVTLLLGSVVDPLAELVVDTVLLGLAVLSLVVKGERVFEVVGKGLSASLDSLFRHVNRPGNC